MPEQPKLTAKEAEKLLLKAGFQQVRVKGSHYIYKRGVIRVVVPFHNSKILHPKIVKQVVDAIGEE